MWINYHTRQIYILNIANALYSGLGKLLDQLKEMDAA